MGVLHGPGTPRAPLIPQHQMVVSPVPHQHQAPGPPVPMLHYTYDYMSAWQDMPNPHTGSQPVLQELVPFVPNLPHWSPRQ